MADNNTEYVSRRGLRRRNHQNKPAQSPIDKINRVPTMIDAIAIAVQQHQLDISKRTITSLLVFPNRAQRAVLTVRLEANSSQL